MLLCNEFSTIPKSEPVPMFTKLIFFKETDVWKSEYFEFVYWQKCLLRWPEVPRDLRSPFHHDEVQEGLWKGRSDGGEWSIVDDVDT